MHTTFSLIWALPFLGLLLSLAILPVIAHDFWNRSFGKVVFFWISLFLCPVAYCYGIQVMIDIFIHSVVAEYVPFIILPAALYVVGGGIYLKRTLPTSALVNTSLLCIGGLMASILGTMGAAIVFIRPILKANQYRASLTHIVIFFILIVANVGGVLTPLGDPPLFLGFLHGVHFFWTTCYLLMPMIIILSYLLLIFYYLDRHLLREECSIRAQGKHFFICQENNYLSQGDSQSHSFDGKINFFLLSFIVLIMLWSGMCQIPCTINLLGLPLVCVNVLRDACLILIILISLRYTPKSARLGNNFSWGPLIEMAQIFLGIFITIVPVILMLQNGHNGGVFTKLMQLLSTQDNHPVSARYFWATGFLSALLDNSPTYLIFFKLAGGHVQWLMNDGASILFAISAGSVFFGSLSYIGNAPNFMIKNIAESYHIKMPSFFRYILLSSLIMLPILAIISFIFCD